jgi:hypothetical protein
VGSTLFVHGGVLPAHVEYGLAAINAETQAWLMGERGDGKGAAGGAGGASGGSGPTATRERRSERSRSSGNGANSSSGGGGSTGASSPGAAATQLQPSGPPAPPAPGFLRGANAVVWARDYSQRDEARCDCEKLVQVLEALPGAKRMVVRAPPRRAAPRRAELNWRLEAGLCGGGCVSTAPAGCPPLGMRAPELACDASPHAALVGPACQPPPLRPPRTKPPRRPQVGHTIQSDGITSACAGRVLRVDVGMSRGCGDGEPEVLEIVGDAVVRRLTEAGAPEVLGAAGQPHQPHNLTGPAVDTPAARPWADALQRWFDAVNGAVGAGGGGGTPAAGPAARGGSSEYAAERQPTPS